MQATDFRQCEPLRWPPIPIDETWAPAGLECNRRAAIENIIDNDPVAAVVREIMADRAQWRGSASDLLDRRQTGLAGQQPRALAGRLRRAQTSLRSLGIEIVFGRGGGCERRQWDNGRR